MKNAQIRYNEAGIDLAIPNTTKEIYQHTKEVAGVPQLNPLDPPHDILIFSIKTDLLSVPH